MGRILVVDDEADVCQLMVKLLKRLGHEAHCATSGAEALSRVKGALPDLILLDVMMPEMSGFEVLRHLRVSEGISVPVIIFTALSDPSVRKQAMDLGANDYWVKASMDLHDMTRRLNEHLSAAG